MTVSALRWFKIALVIQIALVAYWLAIEVVNLFPWNDIASRPETYDLRRAIAINALQLLAYMAIFAFGVRVLAFVSVAGYAGYLAFQTWSWWKPYFLGADPAWVKFYTENFSRTLKVLPVHGANLPPDAQHLALQALTLLALFVTAMAAARMQHL
jgi:hypothetical protein